MSLTCIQKGLLSLCWVDNAPFVRAVIGSFHHSSHCQAHNNSHAEWVQNGCRMYVQFWPWSLCSRQWESWPYPVQGSSSIRRQLDVASSPHKNRGWMNLYLIYFWPQWICTVPFCGVWWIFAETFYECGGSWTNDIVIQVKRRRCIKLHVVNGRRIAWTVGFKRKRTRERERDCAIACE